MKDSILKGYLSDFASQNNLENLDESEVFERFATFCIAAREYPEIGDLEELIVGGGQDSGIDSIVISINGHVVSSIEAAEHFVEQNHQLDIRFSFLQTKTSASFNAGEIGTFLSGVRNFFSEESRYEENEDLETCREIKKYLFSKSIKFDPNPVLKMFYVTTGEWKDDEYLCGRINADVEVIKATSLFSDTQFHGVDAAKLRRFYQELRRKVAKEIEIQRYAVFPPISGVRQAYLGILPCKEYLKLITDSEGELQRSLFYENVRDFQGNNPVNQEISSTVSNTEEQEKLGVLNNGITIVAQSINPVSNVFRLRDFQIVNGCQTSHVIFRHRNQIKDSVCLPVKIIETHDIDIINQITKATNRQTEVKIEAFESLRQFHKDLEEFYGHTEFGIEPRLFYERRSRQYNDTQVMRHQIVTMPFQLKCFVAVFLDEPHSTHRYYGEILQSYKSRVFQDIHSLWPYYTAALIFKKIDSLILDGVLYFWTKRYRYHLAFLFREVFGKPPALRAKEKMQSYCEGVLQAVNSEKSFRGRIVELAKSLAYVKKDMIALQTSRAPLSAQKQMTERLRREVSLLRNRA